MFDSSLPEVLPADEEQGYLYLVQLIPEHTPFRLKVGWTTNLRQRLRQIRPDCPKAYLLRWWHCKKSDESKAIEYIDNEILVFHLSREVIDLPAIDGSVSGLLVCLEKFFDSR